MERELPPYRAAVTQRTRASIWPVLLVAVVLLAAIIGVLRIYAGTRAAWERNQQPSQNTQLSRAIDAGTYQPSSPQILPRAITEEELRALQREEQKRQKARSELRCINGQVFRRIPNGWENLPFEQC